MNGKINVVLCEARDADESQRRLQRELTAALAGRGADCRSALPSGALAKCPAVEPAVLPHLYDLPPEGQAVRYLRSIAGDMVVLSWLYPRAAYWVLRAHGVEGRMGCVADEGGREKREEGAAERTIWCIDLRAHSQTEAILREISRLGGLSQFSLRENGTVPFQGATVSDGEMRIQEEVSPRWYPVIDFHRCVNCLECLNFCLFGAYGLDDAGQVIVEQPDACRDGCPACSRICPREAILFPEYDDPAIAGRTETRAADSMVAGSAQHAEAEGERRQALSHELSAPQREGGPGHARLGLEQLVDELDRSEL
jgi:NAD-dependent dihydropyrimidine dehydrogenase PreA subunit